MWRQHMIHTVVQLIFVLICINIVHGDRPWRWACENGNCIKHKYNSSASSSKLYALDVCKMLCDDYDGCRYKMADGLVFFQSHQYGYQNKGLGLLWPRPTGEIVLGKNLCRLNATNITMEIVNPGDSDSMANLTLVRFTTWSLTSMVPPQVTVNSTGANLLVTVINQNPNITSLQFNTTDESYTVSVKGDNQRINATITASNIFGIRHGLETLSQLIVFDDIKNTYMVQCNASIVDKPVYPYRGILLDTARNFFPVEDIMAMLDAMAMMKFNYFHWHLTDSQSFPFQSTNQPNLTTYGAYDETRSYSLQDISDVVVFALQRGIQVVPEFDSPAHVGEGWQGTGLAICFNKQPWTTYCSEPPCGQLSPIKDAVYDYLEGIYADMASAFPTDIFHMGGDEVNFNCWNSSAAIQNFMTRNKTWPLTSAGFINLWSYFLAKAQERAYTAFGSRIPLILWSSTLTDYNNIEKYIDKDDFIIQAWTTSSDAQIQGLLKKGYQLIISNYDALYFDCGFGAWIGSGNNWCSPYIGWQKIYDNSFKTMGGSYYKGILGAEGVLWSEEADRMSLDGRLWPRASALAERLWAEPSTGWQKAARRMYYNRERLVRVGIRAEALQPKWCYQNEGSCNSTSN